ncbi:hypothetical protein KEM56_001125 [Ascosphaera pollenicola]|nr:hypothetical protein KEM56_001125 [Ascosphaera pollenicola]
MAALERTMDEEACKAAAKGKGEARIVFLDVPCHIIEQLDAEEDTHIKFLDKRNNILEFVMALEMHELTCVLGEKMIEGALARVNQSTAFKQIRASRKHDDDQGQAREADSAFAWRPQYKPKEAPAKWPPIVLEVGASECPRDSKADCKWWLQHSDGAVRVVIVINVHKTRVKTAVYTTGPLPHLFDYREELIVGLVDGNWVFEEEGPITIPFKNIFLRPADASAGEKDLELTKSDFLEHGNDLRELLNGTAKEDDTSTSGSLPFPSAEQMHKPYNLRDLPDRRHSLQAAHLLGLFLDGTTAELCACGVEEEINSSVAAASSATSWVSGLISWNEISGAACVDTAFTGFGLPDVAHIYPFCLTNAEQPTTRLFWESVAKFLPSSRVTWDYALFGEDGIYHDTPLNLLCLGPTAHHARLHEILPQAGDHDDHVAFTRTPICALDQLKNNSLLKVVQLNDISNTATLFFRPISSAHEVAKLWLHGKQMELEFTAAYLGDKTYTTKPFCFHPKKGRIMGPMDSLLPDSEAQDFIASGQVLQMITDDPESHPLPDREILMFQWRMQLVVAAACAGLTDGDRATRPRAVNEFGLDGAADDSNQPLDLTYLNHRLEIIARSRPTSP